MSDITLPDCPKCDAVNTLKAFRSDVNGLKWTTCSCCSAIVLIDADNRIVHVAAK